MNMCMTQGLRKVLIFDYYKETHVETYVVKPNFYFIQQYENAYYFLQLAEMKGGGA